MNKDIKLTNEQLAQRIRNIENAFMIVAGIVYTKINEEGRAVLDELMNELGGYAEECGDQDGADMVAICERHGYTPREDDEE